MSSGSSPSSMRRRLATMSRGLKLGMEVDQPVPMPSAPFTSTVGSTGMYLRAQGGGRGELGGVRSAWTGGRAQQEEHTIGTRRGSLLGQL